MSSRGHDDPMSRPAQWQVGLLSHILRISLVAGLVVYVPSLMAAIHARLSGVAVIDTVAMAAVIALHLATRLPYWWRATLYCLTLYALAVGLLTSVGPASQIYLFGFTTMTTVLVGLRAGIQAIVLSAVTLLLFGVLGWASPAMLLPAWPPTLIGWLVVSLNFALVNALITLAIGAVIRTLGDVLDREIAARLSLERERAQQRTLIDILPDAIFIKDREGRYVTANAAALSILDLDDESALIGKTDVDIFPKELAQAYLADDAVVMGGEPLRNREEHIFGATGDIAWLLTNKVPLRDADGTVTGLLGIARDITERKRAEAERVRLLGRLQMQIDRMPLAYLMTDADFRYIRWNPAAERMFGFSEAEVLGRHPFDVIVSPQAKERVTRLFERIKAGSMDAHTESENLTRDGRLVTCAWFNTPIFEPDGTFAGLLSLGEDITERRNLEQQLRQSQKMEAIGRLAGGVAHDFNNMLTLITGYSELLLTHPQVGAQARAHVREIRDAGERAAALTRQLLGFSRQSMLQPRVIDLNAIVLETGTMLRRLIGEDIVLTTVLDPALHPVKVDPGQLNQVLMNLTVNARDAMPTGGRLTFETANVVVGEHPDTTPIDCPPGRYVRLSISDTGCGMAPDVVSRIFEPFFTTKGVGEGTGLGLAVVFGVVRQSGGSIDVQSEPGKGTTFTLHFPAVIDAVPADIETGPGATTRGTETILLVEDEPAVRALASMSLRLAGYAVLEAVDGQDALRLAAAHEEPIHLVLTDVVMPNIGGPELVSRLRTRLPAIKALFMSGYTSDAVVRHGLLEADVAFIQKPYGPSDLTRKVREVLDAPEDRRRRTP